MNELIQNIETPLATISSLVPQLDLSADERIRIAAFAAQEKKALDITILDISKISSFADYFFLCSATSSPHAQAIADEIERKLREKKHKVHHIEGYKLGEWVLFDYGDFIVHVFTRDCRSFYDLERLWRDAPRLDVIEPVEPIPADHGEHFLI